MKTAFVVLLIGLLCIVTNQVLQETSEPRVIVKYIPRDLDAWFKDPENQPTYMFNSMFNDENVRTF